MMMIANVSVTIIHDYCYELFENVRQLNESCTRIRPWWTRSRNAPRVLLTSVMQIQHEQSVVHTRAVRKYYYYRCIFRMPTAVIPRFDRTNKPVMHKPETTLRQRFFIKKINTGAQYDTANYQFGVYTL